MTKTITIEFDADVVECVVGGKVSQMKLADIHPKAAVKIFQYGFQRFVNDKTGGKSDDEKARIVANALQDIKDGTIQRTTRAADPLQKYRRNIIRDQVNKTDGYKNAEDRNKYLDDIFAKLNDAQKETVEKVALARKKIDDDAAKQVAELDIAIDI
jgi:hypothetical protein